MADHLSALGKSVRLPGFRPGKIPPEILRQRYGTRARAEVMKRLGNEGIQKALPREALLSVAEVVQGGESGDLVLKLSATYLPDLPEADISDLELERLVIVDADPSAQSEAQTLLNGSVLDHLAGIYDFPIAAFLVERELEAIRRAADAELELTVEDREHLDAEFRKIAERRIRLGAVVAELARRHGIAVSDQEVDRERRSASAPFNETPAQTRGRLTEAKVVGWILSRARIRDRLVSRDELGREPDL